MQQLTAHGSSKVVQVAHVVEDVDLAIVQRRLDPFTGGQGPTDPNPSMKGFRRDDQ
jgi:hypothetical protein